MRRILVFVIVLLPVLSQARTLSNPEVIDIGSRLELFVDDYLIDRMTGVRLILHKPIPREVVIVHDKPWEGNICLYHTVFRDGNRFRMYYRGAHWDEQTKKITHQVVCYAESKDGICWTKPELGIIEFNDSRKNNIIWNGMGSHNFAPFKDTNPNCRQEERYKAVASNRSGIGKNGLWAFKSPDGIHWSVMGNEPIITKGAFDSQNLAFWDSTRGRYVDFHREFKNKVRGIMTCTSADFVNWTDPVWLEYPGSPIEHLYTNQIQPYYRALHIFMGFPNRLLPSRKAFAEYYYKGVNDSLFMTSRDGLHFKRWGEAHIRPGLQKECWNTRNNYTAWGILETKSDIPGTPNELSIYNTEGYYLGDSCQLRRFTVRIDGFVSVQAPLSGGEFVTKSVVFKGKELIMNFSTSAAGSVRVEIQDKDGKAIEGFTLAESPQTYGDDIDRLVKWKASSDVSELTGKPIRLRFVMKDADLFSIHFRP